jgi:two-component system, chemotaxis family, CheB/CheR fusion protein
MAIGKPTARAGPRRRSNRKVQPDAGPEPRVATEVPVVAIGASAGGLDPIGRFLGAMPTDSGLAFVVIQHLDPTSKSLLPELLAKHTAMRVRPAENGGVLMANEVYVIPPGVYLSITSGRLRFAAAEAGRGARMPIDAFLHSLAADCGKRGIGIIMSGTGTDGAQGLTALKEAGGLTLVQDPNEAQHDGMPRYAMQAAHPDHVLSVDEMPAALLRYVTHEYIQAPQMPAATSGTEVPGQPDLAEFVGVLKASTGQDFDHYKTGTLQRRIERRMALHSAEDWSDYLAFLRESPAEALALAKDLLINVTRLFRDPDAFAYLATEVLPRVLNRHADDQPIRIWVAGCSTGEEAYSLGILVLELIAAAGRNLGLQIFATDIDDDALEAARTGIYPESIAADVSATRLEQFFIREDGHFKVVKALRDAVIFSRHNVLVDPPFSKLDLVSCRNLLIYVKPDAQRRVLSLLHFGLKDDGVLLLGSAESVSSASGLFEPVDEKHRIYRRLANRSARVGFPLAERSPSAPSRTARVTPPPSLSDLVRRTMLETYAPAAVVSNRQHAALYYFGATDRYLQIVPGEPSQDILSMAREGLRPKLREVIARAFRGRRRVAAHGVRLERAGGTVGVTIEALRLGDGHDDLVLVSFIDELPRPGDSAPRGSDEAVPTTELARLRQGLADTRKELNTTIHDLRRANETLKTKNEEAMSLNEEFLSTNEELESSKEELQSLNEELTTVNTQLRQSLEQQQQASNDLSNLLNSSAVATILLDSQLCIKLFNPRMRALFSLIDADIGRPLADLLPKFADPQLLADATAARAEGTLSEREIRAESGAWYIRSILPYRTETGDVQGAVVTFADVSRLKQAELAATAAQDYAETIVDAVREPLVVLDQEFRVVSANSAFQAAFDLMADNFRGRTLRDLGHSILADAQLLDLLARVLPQQQASDHIELDIEQANNREYRVWQANARRFHAPSAEGPMILLALDDITDERRIVRRQLQLMIDALPGAFLAIDSQRRIRFISSEVESLFGYRAEDLIGQLVDLLVPSDLRERHAALHAGFVAQPGKRPMGNGLDIHGVTKDGARIPLDIGLSPLHTADGLFIIAAVHDLRPQKQSEMQLRKSKAAADRANLAKSRFLAAASHDLRQPLQALGLMHGVLQKRVADRGAQTILTQADNVVVGMAELLDTFLDINQIDSGEIKPEIVELPVAAVLARARDEFAPLASAKDQKLRVVPSRVMIRSDRRLLARMVGNLLSNAIKYSDQGKILLGCRRRGGTLRIEVWDTGIGIPPESIDAVFDEFYRVDRNDGSKFGLGLGLYIVRRLAVLLGHAIEVRSRPGKGTMFAIVVSGFEPPAPALEVQTVETDTSRPAILLVEDDPAQVEALCGLLELEGYRVAAARRGSEALACIRGPAAVHPDAVVADYNLPGGMTGLQIIQQVRTELGAQIPALIVSGDKSATALRQFEANGQVVITKPVKTAELLAAVATLVRMTKPGWSGDTRPAQAAVSIPVAAPDAVVGIIDDEPGVRGALRMMLEAAGHTVATYASAEAFIADPDRSRLRCLVVDLKMPGMSGLELQNHLKSERVDIPLIFVTGSGDLPLAVQAMREGAADFLQKPVRSVELLASVERALAADQQTDSQRAEQEKLAARLATLSARERQVMERMLAGQPNKNIAADLGISQRTTEHHRQNVMRKMETKSLAMLIRTVGLHAKPSD